MKTAVGLPRKTLTTRAGATVSFTSLGLGTAPLGNIYRPVAEADADATFDAAWDCGVRYFDTAPYYGRGLAETRLNRFLRGKPRGDYVLSTKVGRVLKRIPPEEMGRPSHYFDTPAREVVYDYSRDGILRSVEHSLERLGADRIDVLLVHDIDPITHGSAERSEAHITMLCNSGMLALDELRAAGVVGAIGSGLNVTATTEELVRRLDLDVVLLAGRYTLLEQGPLATLFPLCDERGTRVIAAGVFNSGLLAGGATYNYSAAPAEIIARAARIGELCQSHGVKIQDAAVQFASRHPAVITTLVGAVSAREVRCNVASLAKSIPQDLWIDLKAAGLLDDAAPV
jgi:D-threo-aldose 1-dehydrogenase